MCSRLWGRYRVVIVYPEMATGSWRGRILGIFVSYCYFVIEEKPWVDFIVFNPFRIRKCFFIAYKAILSWQVKYLKIGGVPFSFEFLVFLFSFSVVQQCQGFSEAHL